MKGKGCSAAGEHKSHDQDVVGLNPTECWDFFSALSFSFSCGFSANSSLEAVLHNCFSIKMINCSAIGKTKLKNVHCISKIWMPHER